MMVISPVVKTPVDGRFLTESRSSFHFYTNSTLNIQKSSKTLARHCEARGVERRKEKVGEYTFTSPRFEQKMMSSQQIEALCPQTTQNVWNKRSQCFRRKKCRFSNEEMPEICRKCTGKLQKPQNPQNVS